MPAAARPLRFEKWQALGNDFLLVDGPPPPPAMVRLACDRRLGAGADGAVFFEGDDPVRAWLFNADGSRAAFSGNGFRCLAGLLLWRLPGRHSVRIRCGVLDLEGLRGARRGRPGLALDVAGLGEASCRPAPVAIRRVLPRAIRAAPSNVVVLGNSHLLIWLGREEFLGLSGPGEGGRLDEVRRGVPGFAGGINVSLVAGLPGRRAGVEAVALATWERGVGRTPACASAACAAVFALDRDPAAAAAVGVAARGPVEVVSAGGVLVVEREGARIVLWGGAGRVLSGEIDPGALAAPARVRGRT